MSASALNLHPAALEDLRRSGLSDSTIAEAGLYTPAPGDLPRLLSARLVERVQHVLVFPYDSPGHGGLWRRDDEFVRCKLFPPVRDGEGHTMRYYQRSGTPPRLYIPTRARTALADPSVPLLITEGEKKALKANQEGLACVAVGGLWNWQGGGRPIADLDRIDWCDRETWIVPDSDVWTRPDLLQPVFALGKELESRGAKVAVLKLPPGPNGTKVGLDDHLASHPPGDVGRLARLGLKHPVFARTATWWREWITRREEPASTSAGALELLERPETVRVLHPAQDVTEGVLWYGLPVEGTLVMITSNREAYRADLLPAGVALRHTDPGRSTVSRAVALAWLKLGGTGAMGEALDGLAAFFTRYVVLRDPRSALLVGTWVAASWCYRAFRIFPYLSIRSAEKRCGKTRLLGLLARVGFNASPVTAHPTEALLYRSAARTGGVQLFDEVETLRGDKDRFEALINVLNVGFERGAVVPRYEKRGDKMVEVPHEAYAPRVLAGIAGLKETLEDRALPLFMLRRRRSEAVARLGRATEAEAQALRERCALASLTRIHEVCGAYERAPELLERAEIDDRAVDLWLPLVSVALVADAEEDRGRTRQLLELAKEVGTMRDAEAETGTTARLLEALEAIRQQQGTTLAPADLVAALRARPGWDWLKSPRRLASLLNPLELYRQQVWDGQRRRWAYVLDASQLADLQARYGGGGEPGEEKADHPPQTGANR